MVDNALLLEILDPAGSAVLVEVSVLVGAGLLDLLLVLRLECVDDVYGVQTREVVVSGLPAQLSGASVVRLVLVRGCVLGEPAHRISSVQRLCWSAAVGVGR